MAVVAEVALFVAVAVLADNITETDVATMAAVIVMATMAAWLPCLLRQLSMP